MWPNFQNIFMPCLVLLVAEASCKKYTIHWDANLIPELKEELKIEVHINDWMDILCPHKAGSNQFKSLASGVVLDLYNVSSQNYENCNVTDQQRLLRCKEPGQEIKLTTKFQRKSPSPIGFVFQPGHTYYYISKTSRSNFYGCFSDTLRMVITVKENYSGPSFRCHNHNRISSKNRRTISNKKLPKIQLPTPASLRRNSKESAAAMQMSTIYLPLLVVIASFLKSFIEI